MPSPTERCSPVAPLLASVHLFETCKRVEAPFRSLPRRGAYRSTNPGSVAGRADAFAASQPVMYIHWVTRVSFG
jgi:hypothetical protein